MERLKGELVRLCTNDKLELQGFLFESKTKTKKVLVHIHAWIGNFYENLFLDYIAKEAVSNGIAFLTFNNRGAGIVTDFIKRNSETKYERIGGSIEKFEDCVYDISAAIEFLKTRGYEKIILEGHSLGCQKVAYYAHKLKDSNPNIKGLVLLAPVDDVGYVKRLLGEKRYEESLNIARDMAKKGDGNKAVPEWMAFYPMLSAGKYLDVADPETISGRLFYYSGELAEIRSITAPMFAIFGSNDDYESEPGKKLETLKAEAKNCETKLFEGANHWFSGNEPELGKIIAEWIKITVS